MSNSDAQSAPPEILALTGALICDGRGAPRAAEIILKGGVIEAILPPGGRLPQDARLYDLSGLLVTPGLIDVHTHLFAEGDPTRPDLVYDALPFRVLRGAARARLLLSQGFTTLRDVCTEGAGYADVALAKATRQGHCVGPRVIPSGPGLATTGGYLPVILSPDLCCAPTACMTADGVDEMRRAVRAQIQQGVAWIKVFVDWPKVTADGRAVATQPTISEEELRCVVEEATRLGRRVAAHAMSDDGARLAINCGVGSVEHMGLLTRETLAKMADCGTFLVPTWSVMVRHLEGLATAHRPGFQAYMEKARESFQAALDLNVPIASGSDIGSYPHETRALSELGLLMEYGMSPEAALWAATGAAATLLDLPDLGKLETHARADLCAFRIPEGSTTPLIDALSGASPVVVFQDGAPVVQTASTPQTAG